jgi:hypothetical protein
MGRLGRCRRVILFILWGLRLLSHRLERGDRVIESDMRRIRRPPEFEQLILCRVARRDAERPGALLDRPPRGLACAGDHSSKALVADPAKSLREGRKVRSPAGGREVALG